MYISIYNIYRNDEVSSSSTLVRFNHCRQDLRALQCHYQYLVEILQEMGQYIGQAEANYARRSYDDVFYITNNNYYLKT